MTRSVEWANASDEVPNVLIALPREVQDAYGQKVDRGHAGLWVSETMLVEGTPDELVEWAERVLLRAKEIAADPDEHVRPAAKKVPVEPTGTEGGPVLSH